MTAAVVAPWAFFDSGLHRRHGRNPASLAATDSGKKTTFERFGRRDGQVGRQKTLVDVTPYKN